MAYYERNKAKPAFILMIILLLLVIAAGVYFYLLRDELAIKKRLIETYDYSQGAVSVSVSGLRQPEGYPAAQTSSESLNPDIYITPLGFPIESHSKNWQGDKLKEIYDELLLNKHGEEINYISKIVVNGGVSEIGTKDSVVAGTHSTTQEYYQVFFDMPALVPSSLKYGLSTNMSVIELYNMDEYDTIEQAARTISHEYGHHYTIFYFMSGDEQVKESQYYSLRDFKDYDHKLFFSNQQEYLENHMWSIYEIAAEDYVQLLGSPNTRQTREYMDVFDALGSGNGTYKIYADSNTANVFPQENMQVPLANDVSGLRDYFLSFINDESDLESLTKDEFNIQIEKKSNLDYVYYKITWDNIYNNADTLYTLVCYDTDKQIYLPVRTVNGNEKTIARVGTAAKIKGNAILSRMDGVPDEDRYFRLIVILPDGRIISSDYYFADF